MGVRNGSSEPVVSELSDKGAYLDAELASGTGDGVPEATGDGEPEADYEAVDEGDRVDPVPGSKLT